MRRADRLWAASVLSWGLLWQVAADAALETTAPVPQSGAGVDRGVVHIACKTGTGNEAILSRGAVLDLELPDRDPDIILTAAHGLPAERTTVLHRCRVFGAHGRPYRIGRVWRAAADDPTALGRDWAVLLLKRRLAGKVGRVRPARVLPDALVRLAAERAPVRLADLPHGDCNLRSPDGDRLHLMMVYSCHSFPGSSGSPILAGLDGRTVVIGIHLAWGLVSIGGSAHSTSIGRPIDTEIAAAITAAAAESRR